MEMVQAKLIVSCVAVSLMVCACGPRVEWEKHVMDSHRTGVTAVAGDDPAPYLGTVDSVYHAPNGRTFECGVTPVVARRLLYAQPRMAYLKEVLAYAPEEMRVYPPESELGNWTVDAVMFATESVTGRHIDVGVMNIHGIRRSMPKGQILLDDILSMFPFNNHFCYVALKGEDLHYLLDVMAGRDHPEALGGVRFVIRDGKACDITVGGKPLDESKVYGVATIDFLLDGGDGIHVARNARELIVSDVRIMDWMVPYIRTLGASGEYVEYEKDGRVTIE